MRRVGTVAELRAARAGWTTLGFVPTMGFLHEGHLSLVRRARAERGAVCVSIFVNPMQFGANEDLSRYPRDMDRDLALLAEAGADLVFTPEGAEVYPPGFATRIEITGITEPLEGAVRPGHFTGVATVVAKLFNMVQPTTAYFGQKDAQQVAVIKTLVRDLDMPVEIVVAPTVREADGLAMSSRNAYLDPAERTAATVLYRALEAARHAYEAGERAGQALRDRMAAVLAAEPLARVDYVSIADPLTLAELEAVAGPALASMAVRIGRTRLIDNLVLGEPA